MPTKKAATKKTVSSSTSETPHAVASHSTKKSKLTKRNIIIAGIVLLAAILLFVFKGLFVAAVVDGTPITRFSVINALEKQSGKKTLDALVTQSLIYKEADRQKIKVTQQDVDQEIKKIEQNITQQGQKLDDLLAFQGMTRKDLNDQVKLQKILTLLVDKNIEVTNQEVDSYIETNKESLQGQTIDDALKANVKEQLKQEKVQQKVQELVDSLKQKAKIYYFVNY